MSGSTSTPLPRLARAAAVVAAVACAAAVLPPVRSASATTPTGTVVVTRVDAGGDRDLYVRDMASGHERPLVGDDGDDHSAVWSPDGSRVAFVREAGGQADVYVVNADGSGFIRITEDLANDRSPAWSPDSAAVVFDSDRAAGRLRQIYRVPLNDLLLLERITTSTVDEHYAPTASPDGHFVTVVRRTPSEPAVHPQIVRVRISDRTATPLTEAPADHADPEYSADGSRIAFTSDRGNVTGNHDVYVMDADGGHETRLTASAHVESSPRWSATSDTLDSTILYTAAVAADDHDLRTVSADGTTDAGYLTAATDDVFGDTQPARECSITWHGGAGTGSWHTAGNWDLGRVPGAADVVCIPDVEGAVTVAYSSGTTSIASLTTSEDVTLDGGTLTVPTVAVHAPARLTLRSGMLGGATLLDRGDVAWVAGGTVPGAGALTVAAAATLHLVTTDGSYWVPAATTITNHGTLAVGTAAHIHGDGSVRNAAGGSIVKDSPAHTTQIATAFANDGVLVVTSGGLTVPATLTTQGTAGYDAATGELRGGTYRVGDDGVLAFDAPVTIRDSSATFDLTGGAAVVDSTGSSALRELETNRATLLLHDGATVPTTTTVTNHGVIGGTGAITASLVNAGLLAPDALDVSGTLTQLDTGTLHVEVAGTSVGAHDTVNVTGAAMLAGTLEIVTRDGFSPRWDDDALVVATPAPTAAFATVTGAELPSGLRYRATNAPGGVRVVATDVIAPTPPGVTGGSHGLRRWSRDATIDVTLAGGTDAHSGVDGYAVAWSTSPTSQPPAATTTAGTTATVTSPRLASGRPHYVHVRTRDRQGLSSATLHHGPFWIDTMAPRPATLTSPATVTAHSLRTGPARSPRIRVAWRPPSDAHSGVASQVLIRRSTADGTTWKASRVNLPAGARSRTVAARPGTTSCFRVRGSDRAGNAATSRETCAATPLDSAALQRASQHRWSRRVSTAFYRGSALTSATRGAALRRSGVRARRIALVATTCRGCGTVRVLFNGRPVGRRISLNATRTRHRRVIPVTTFRGVRRGAVTVKVVTARRPVTIDALGVHLR